MTTIKLKAYLPSVSDIRMMKRKFPAFVSALISNKAAEQQVATVATSAVIADTDNDKNDIKTNNFGIYFLRTPHYTDAIKAVGAGGTRTLNPSCDTTGLRIAISLTYTPDSPITNSCHFITRTVVWSFGRYENKETSTAPIITYAGNEYIWLNKEDCESGQSQVMTCISLDLLEQAEPYYQEQKKKVLFLNVSDKSVYHNDYAKAEKLRAQCEKVAFENASETEKQMAVDVEMSSQDGYDKIQYILPNSTQKNTLEAETNLAL